TLRHLEQANFPNCEIDVAKILEGHESETIFFERQSKLERIEEKSVSPDRKARDEVARPRLVDGKSAVRFAAAHEESLGQRDALGARLRRPIGRFHLKVGVAREDQSRPQTMVSCVLAGKAEEIRLRPQGLPGNSRVRQ